MRQLNQATNHIDEVPTIEMVKMFNEEDKKVALAVEGCTDKIAAAVDEIVACLQSNGRLFYIGSGTGGKIGFLDATECPPTFGVSDDMVIPIISGGNEGLAGWREDTEDDEELAVQDLKARNFSRQDILVAISASGNTPYVLAAVRYAQGLGSKTIGLCCSPGGQIEGLCLLCITIDVGAEAIMGSTRLKSGTAQKMVLNMLSSCTMISLGKTYNNLMVDVRPINNKLRRRVLDIIMLATGQREQAARQALGQAKENTKLAILMLLLNIDAAKGQIVLEKYKGHLKKAVRGELGESNCRCKDHN
jgi:N-acetylmuramic acid 6-phosphate etherase